MAKRRRKKKDSSSLAFFLLFLIVAITLYTEFKPSAAYETNEEVLPVTEDLNIYFIDVGQADSIWIRNSNHNVLIDAGNNADGKKLVTFLKDKGVEKFDYVIGTHAHEDHIGGMDDIIKSFYIDHFMMPNVLTTTKTFEDVLDALDKRGYFFETPKIDSTFRVGDMLFEVLYLSEDNESLNNSSIVLRLSYGEKHFLFMGDAEAKVEKQILDKNISADVLKVGHHGSEYSTSVEFLNKVNPTYAVIQVGKDNKYNHPKDIILRRLSNKNVKIYRTDQSGTIHLNCDGKNITFDTFETDTEGN